MADEINAAHHARWTLLKTEKQVGLFVRGNAIPEYFVAHAELGSPITIEADTGDGGRVQSFTGGVITWYPDRGAQLVTS